MSGARVHLALLEPGGSALLWRESEGGPVLPCIETDTRYAADVTEVVRRLAERGFAATVLRTVVHLHGGDGERGDILYLAEAGASDAPAGYRWGPCPPPERFASDTAPRRPELYAALQRALAQETSPPRQRVPWARRGWHAQAESWVDAELVRLGRPRRGPMEQIKQWSITSLWRVPTVDGPTWFKAAPPLPLFADEGRIVAALSERFPERAPRLLAHDPDRRWALFEDFGAEIASEDAIEDATEEDTERRRRAVGAFAALQVETATRTDELLAAGAIDRRRAVLDTQLDHLLAKAEERLLLTEEERGRLPRLAPRLRAALDELHGFAIPDALVHGDLHFGNMAFLADGEALFYDWTDAAVAHPFFDLAPLFGFPEDPAAERLSALKRAYLEPWLPYEPLPRLWRACELGIILANAFHAVSYQVIREATEADARWEFEGMTAMCLRRLLTLL